MTQQACWLKKKKKADWIFPVSLLKFLLSLAIDCSRQAVNPILAAPRRGLSRCIKHKSQMSLRPKKIKYHALTSTKLKTGK
ncbi:hypothetical protein CEF21_10080 [Bacillus sp. FJAT-42376]|uniref:hypothetical protein n=1 Tax=Bacillus sp. FJAT-42376 TaxID=2014076 RepID=UPI000F4DFD0D|nr:hypothetical protein [Bacillus sp. FJAT-42376]AZB42608.1 hypothetical protein CEF21_10080 [Bacillus sp. FJAT-42376]